MFARILICICTALLFCTPAKADTWLFAAGACPPWKNIPNKPELSKAMAGACAEDIRLFTDSFQNFFNIAQENITTLVDAAATGDAVSAALNKLSKKVSRDDRVIIYINTHGGAVDAIYKGYNAHDEVLAWYTEEEPADMTAATAAGDWMTMRALRDLTNQIVASEIVIIIEACHAASGMNDFVNDMHNGIGGRGTDWQGRETVIFSSDAEQIANFTKDTTKALFTSVLADVIENAAHQATLFDVFEAARLKTHRIARATCKTDHSLKDLLEDWANYKIICTQMPTAWDPFGLLDDMSSSKNTIRP